MLLTITALCTTVAVRVAQSRLRDALELYHEALMVVRVQSAQGHRDVALALLGDLLRAAEAAQRPGSVIALLVVEALVRAIHGGTSKALVAIGRALTLAEPEQYVRIFVDEGPPMAQLLHMLLAHDVTVSYAGTTIDAIRS